VISCSKTRAPWTSARTPDQHQPPAPLADLVRPRTVDDLRYPCAGFERRQAGERIGTEAETTLDAGERESEIRRDPMPLVEQVERQVVTTSSSLERQTSQKHP